MSFIDENVITGKTYYYKLRACNAYGYCSGYSKVVSRKVIPVTPAFAISSTETKKINIKLATRDIVTGYQIFASTRKNGTYVKIAQLYDPEDLNFTYNSKKGTTYYFKVRSYININGKYYYSNFSGIKYIKSK